MFVQFDNCELQLPSHGRPWWAIAPCPGWFLSSRLRWTAAGFRVSFRSACRSHTRSATTAYSADAQVTTGDQRPTDNRLNLLNNWFPISLLNLSLSVSDVVVIKWKIQKSVYEFLALQASLWSKPIQNLRPSDSRNTPLFTFHCNFFRAVSWIVRGFLELVCSQNRQSGSVILLSATASLDTVSESIT